MEFPPDSFCRAALKTVINELNSRNIYFISETIYNVRYWKHENDNTETLACENFYVFEAEAFFNSNKFLLESDGFLRAEKNLEDFYRTHGKFPKIFGIEFYIKRIMKVFIYEYFDLTKSINFNEENFSFLLNKMHTEIVADNLKMISLYAFRRQKISDKLDGDNFALDENICFRPVNTYDILRYAKHYQDYFANNYFGCDDIICEILSDISKNDSKSLNDFPFSFPI